MFRFGSCTTGVQRSLRGSPGGRTGAVPRVGAGLLARPGRKDAPADSRGFRSNQRRKRPSPPCSARVVRHVWRNGSGVAPIRPRTMPRRTDDSLHRCPTPAPRHHGARVAPRRPLRRRPSAKETKDVAIDEAKNVGQTAAEAGSQVAATATDQAKQVAQETQRQAKDLLDQGRTQVKGRSSPSSRRPPRA